MRFNNPIAKKQTPTDVKPFEVDDLKFQFLDDKSK
jgi:hypothetical protein